MKLILQDSANVTRTEFYGKCLASLGVPLIQAGVIVVRWRVLGLRGEG
jgi:hypothetical protein